MSKRCQWWLWVSNPRYRSDENRGCARYQPTTELTDSTRIPQTLRRSVFQAVCACRGNHASAKTCYRLLQRRVIKLRNQLFATSNCNVAPLPGELPNLRPHFFLIERNYFGIFSQFRDTREIYDCRLTWSLHEVGVTSEMFMEYPRERRWPVMF